MKFFSCILAAVTTLFLLSSASAQITGDLKIAFIRISFEKTVYPGFTGNGDYLLTSSDICGKYLIDPPPHDKNYFSSHILAVNNYFKKVSHGNFGIDVEASKIYPSKNTSSYKLSKSMNYYNELGKENEHEYRITTLLKDAIEKAYNIDQIDFNNFDLIAVIHPGLGQDFNLPFLDPTPEDIPSTFIDKEMVLTHLKGPIITGASSIYKGIILPESQNHPLMDSAIFDILTEPCDLQYSITGTWALMIGFAVGLPPLWQIETGQSGVGIFGLMDQGSNNGRGIVPSIPNPWTRIYAGWELPEVYKNPQEISLINGKQNSIAKIPLSESEYFLIENRNNWFRYGVGIDSARLKVWESTNSYPNYVTVLFDSTGINKDEYGVVRSINNYNIGLPASGLLIWHIDENRINENISDYKINANIEAKGIDIEEADGAQDIGYISNLITDPSSGYWGDMWFRENSQFYRANTTNQLEFSPYTYPNTQTNNGYSSGVNINNISKTDTLMSFELSSSYNSKLFDIINKSILFQWDIDQDGKLEFFGTGDSLWWSNSLNELITFKENLNDKIQVCIANNTIQTAIAVIEELNSSYNIIWYEFDNELNNFIVDWNHNIESTNDLILLGADKNTIFFLNDTIYYQLDKNGLSKIPFPEHILVYTTSNNSNIFYKNQNLITDYGQSSLSIDFTSVSLADLDLDNSVDIVAIDKIGNIHAFDENLVYKNGFPIKASAISSVLIADLLGNRHPEIVFEQKDGSIIITNYEGVFLESLSLNADTKLSSIGIYNSKNTIILNNQLLMYKDWNGEQYNRWIYKNSSPDFSRYLSIDTLKNTANNIQLLNNELTYAYPNPSYGEKITFRLQASSIQLIKISIYDLAGFLQESISIPVQNNLSDSSESTIEIPWDTKGIESGIYLAKIHVSNGNNSAEKILKLGVIK